MDASEQQPEVPPARLRIVVLASRRETGEALVRSMQPSFIVGSTKVDLEVADADEAESGLWRYQAGAWDGVVIAVRFMDSITMNRIRALYRMLPDERILPILFVVCREPAEIEFKIACPNCSQKLWVGDHDVGREGRCPQCKKAFPLFSQSSHLKAQLLLGEASPVLLVNTGNPSSCKGALAALADLIQQRRPTGA